MKFTCESIALSRAMASATRALASKAIMPVLEGVYIRAMGSSVLLRCTDLKMTIECTIPAQVDSPGQAVLQGKLFAELARRLPDGNVDVAIEEEGETRGAYVTAPGLRTRLFIMDAAEYPEISQVTDGVQVKLGAQLLRDLIRQCVFAAAQDEARPVLTGALLELGQGQCRMVAVDGYRLAMCTAPYEGDAQDVRAVIPAQALTRLASLIDVEEALDMEFSPSHVSVTVGATRMICRLLEGDFIDYNRIIPDTWTTRFTVNRAEMSEALDRAAMLAREGMNNLVRFSLTAERLNITSNSDRGNIDEDIAGSMEGNELDIAFNVRYLIDVFRNIEDGEVRMDFNSPVTPCVMHSASGNASYLVLPVRLHG